MARGGPFAEKRIIDLINRRFVAYYYNVSERMPGYNKAAAQFFEPNQARTGSQLVRPIRIYAPKFSEDAELLAEISTLQPKDAIFDQLINVLLANGRHPKLVAEDRELLKAAQSESGTVADQMKAAIMYKEIGGYSYALRIFERLIALGTEDSQNLVAQAHLHAAQIHRYAKDWALARKHINQAASLNRHNQFDLDADLAMERAHELLSRDQFDAARKLLVETIKLHPINNRMGELHYYAGQASYFLGKREWANYHWCWVMNNIPHDHHYMRCYQSVAAESSMGIFPNFELGGYSMTMTSASTTAMDSERSTAQQDYVRLRKHFAHPDYWNREITQSPAR